MRKTIYLLLIMSSLLLMPLYGIDNKNAILSQHTIILEEDLDSDGNSELVQYMEKPNDLLTIYINSNNNYEKMVADKGAEIDNNIRSTGFKYATLNRNGKKSLFLLSNLYTFIDEKSFSCGNIILIYQFDGKQIKLEKKLYSNYVLINEGKVLVNKITDIENAPLGYNGLYDPVVDNKNSFLVIQADDGYYEIGTELILKKISMKIPRSSMIIGVRENKGDKEFILFNSNKKHKKINVISKNSGFITSEMDITSEKGSLGEIKFDENADNFSISFLKDGNKVRKKYSIDRKKKELNASYSSND